MLTLFALVFIVLVIMVAFRSKQADTERLEAIQWAIDMQRTEAIKRINQAYQDEIDKAAKQYDADRLRIARDWRNNELARLGVTTALPQPPPHRR